MSDEQENSSGNNDTSNQNQGGQQQPTPTPAEFAIPETYKDKEWAANIKSHDDLWSGLDKAYNTPKEEPIDFTKATPAEIEKHFEKIRPADKGVYKFGEDTPPEFKEKYQDMLYNAGLNEYQGNKIIEAYQAFEAEQKNAMFGEENFNEVMKKSFGEGYKEQIAKITPIISKNVNDADKAMIDALPNEFLGLFYRYAENLQKQYGIKESNIETGKASSAPIDRGAKIKEILGEIAKTPSWDFAKKEQLLAEYNKL